MKQKKKKKKSSGGGKREAEGRRSPLTTVRNIGIMAHIDAGKTTLTERMLYYSGRVHRMGEVHDGNTAMDWMPQERERGITITSAATTFFWQDCQINLIDTPGHVDFTAEVERSLRVLDGAVGVFCAVGGVQSQSETVWHQADRYDVPRIAFINKMDRIGADFEAVILQMRHRLSEEVIPIEIPWGAEDNHRGVIDLLKMEAIEFVDESLGSETKIQEIPADLVAQAESARAELVEKVADKDEEVLAAYLDNADVSEDILRGGVRRAVIANELVPVLCGSALRNKGVQEVLGAVVDFLPSPLDNGAIKGRDPKSDQMIEREANDFGEMSGLIFKFVSDPYLGNLVLVRVYSGQLKKGQNIFNPRTKKRERVMRLYQLHADRRTETDTIFSGEIGAIGGLKGFTTGDTVCAESSVIELGSMTFPEPVVSMAIEPKTQGDRDKLMTNLDELAAEDPTFTVTVNEETGQTIVNGMGELHLEILKDRLFREFKVEANAGKPMVAYKETIKTTATGEFTFDRDVGGKRHFGRLVIEVAPNPRGEGNSVAVETSNEVIPADYKKCIESAISDGLSTGVIGNCPLVDLSARVVDGASEEDNSSEMAYRSAAVMALRAAVMNADPAFLEPIMSLEIVTPTEHMGDVLADLSARGGRVGEMVNKGLTHVIKARVPLAQLFGYATAVRSLSKGRASYTMEPCCFEVVSKATQTELLNR